MPRSLSAAALLAIADKQSSPKNLIYMDISGNEQFLAIDCPPPGILFQRDEGPILDDEPVLWTAVGGVIAPGPAEESGDPDADGQEIQFAAVDPNFQLGGFLLANRPFNRVYQHWKVHLWPEGHAQAGTVRASYLVHHGKMNGRFAIHVLTPEEIDVFGAQPGTINVTLRSMTPFALLDVARNIKCNLESHQRWYPDDMGMEYVSVMMHHKLFWGINSPDEGSSSGSS